ncbi:MAG: hypothetical protein HGA87_01120 [Desulfobulbaceae bacterium]|nr:hypothetical protein [Desulfobulbaceae bacterium]
MPIKTCINSGCGTEYTAVEGSISKYCPVCRRKLQKVTVARRGPETPEDYHFRVSTHKIRVDRSR